MSSDKSSGALSYLVTQREVAAVFLFEFVVNYGFKMSFDSLGDCRAEFLLIQTPRLVMFQ